MDTLQYIKPNQTNTDGCGVIIGNQFVTAGHVVESGGFIFYHNKQKYNVTVDASLICESLPEENITTAGYDLAIFHNDNLSSPIIFSTEPPVRGQECVSISYKHHGGVDERYEVIEGSAIIDVIEDNFFSCKMEKPLMPGASGSPLFNKQGEVIGILTHGDYDSGICVFMSSIAIMNRINNARQ